MSLPGLALAYAISSCTLFTGTLGCAANRFGCVATREIVAKSRSGSYGSLYSPTLSASGLLPPISSV